LACFLALRDQAGIGPFSKKSTTAAEKLNLKLPILRADHPAGPDKIFLPDPCAWWPDVLAFNEFLRNYPAHQFFNPSLFFHLLT
jgi:hypothetical protein